MVLKLVQVVRPIGKLGYIDTIENQQEYDLQAVWGAVSESNKRIEIRRVFHERSPAISRGGFGFGDVGNGPSDGTNNLLGEFGWAGYDGGLNAIGGGVTGHWWWIFNVAQFSKLATHSSS
jgi:hypothetical protein